MIKLKNNMSLNDECLNWKKEDFIKAFDDITYKIKNKVCKKYNAVEIWREVQDLKKSKK